jgi:DNA replication and repair protein RecF
MLLIHQLILTQYRNYAQQSFSFEQPLVAICGKNGSGKTNLLDAIYISCFTRSHFFKPEHLNIQFQTNGYRIQAFVEKNKVAYAIECILKDNKKEFLLNHEAYKKLSLHIGKFPCVIIAPDDTTLVTEGSAERRKLMDALLAQTEPDYLQYLIHYTKLLQQRNSLLHSIKQTGFIDKILLETLNEQLSRYGEKLFHFRSQFAEQFIPLVLKEYAALAPTEEHISLQYESQLQSESLQNLLQHSLQTDIALQRTTCGIHKDELVIQLQNELFKNIASQGQRKSMLFALKLAEFEMLKAKHGFAPLLLIDDIYEKLDRHRIHQLLQKVCLQNNGQVLITDTHTERVTETFKQLKMPYQIIELE